LDLLCKNRHALDNAIMVTAAAVTAVTLLAQVELDDRN
jgi:hypothetical protein